LVVTDHKLASLAGAKILKQGGNAVDAAVATATALSVIDPFMSGLTGFGYLLFYNANDDQVYALDFIGTAPAAASIDLYNKEKPWEDYKPTAEGILAALVPGSVAGWSAITEKFGRMRWKELLAPAIELAGGFTVSTEIHRHYEFLKPRAMMNPITARTFYKDGSFPEPGELFSQKDLARTLEMLAERGAEDFYRGEIAKKMVAYIQEAGGIITEEDLASYKVEWTRPVVGTYSDHRLFSHAPGSSGITVLQWLNILEGSNFEGIGWDTDSFIHTFLEAGKLTLRDDDMYNTGKDYVKVPVELLTSKKYAAKQRSQINPEQAKFYPLVSASRPFPQGTTTFCTCDAEGNMVSMTLTQMYGFDRVGLIGNLGFNLNGGICYFSLDPNHIERLEPRQRPRYVMSPTIAFKDDMTIAIGAAGGWTIPQTITQTLMKILEFDMEAQEAVSSPRFVMRYRYNSIPYPPGTTVELEDGIPDLTRKSLDRRGHRIFKPPLNFPSRYRHGLVNALTYENGTMQGGAEIRRDGYAAVC
jgi:gamma-glutamyltranspeptidase/glutathione hydrolase